MGNSDFPGLHLHNGAKRQLPEDGVWRAVTVNYFRHCAILLSVSGYDISCLPWALTDQGSPSVLQHIVSVESSSLLLHSFLT